MGAAFVAFVLSKSGTPTLAPDAPLQGPPVTSTPRLPLHSQRTIDTAAASPRGVNLTLDAKLAALVAAAQSSMDPADFETLLNKWVADLKEGEIPSALHSLESEGLSRDMTTDLTARLIRHWAEFNLNHARAWVDGMPNGPARELAVENVAIMGANQDLAQAASWALSRPQGSERDKAVFAVANEAIRTQPDEALTLIATMPKSPARDDLICRAAAEYATEDHSAAVQWADQIPDSPLRTHVMSGVLLAWSENDPRQAAEAAVRTLPAGPIQDDTVVGIAQRWAESDPQSAAAWISLFPAGSLRQAAIMSVGSIWLQSDPKLASTWLADLKK